MSVCSHKKMHPGHFGGQLKMAEGIERFQFKFKHPFTCLVSGPTQSGKTHFTLELLERMSDHIQPVPSKVIWCYGAHQEKLNHLPTFVQVSEGLSALDDIDGHENTLVILDDLMHEAGNNAEVASLFTKGSHHRNMSVIMIVQNLFHKGSIMRTVSLNAHYMIIFKNPRDASQLQCLGRQLFPGKSKFLVDAYRQATSRPHGYLLLDLTQNTPDSRRVLSDILSEAEVSSYTPK